MAIRPAYASSSPWIARSTSVRSMPVLPLASRTGRYTSDGRRLHRLVRSRRCSCRGRRDRFGRLESERAHADRGRCPGRAHSHWHAGTTCHHPAEASSQAVRGARVDRLLLGLIAIAVGALIAAYGARGVFLLLPLFGFVVGYLVGAQVVTNLFGDGVFATLTSWVAGLVVAVLFAVLAGLWWWAAVVILFGVVGYEVGYGVLVAIGFNDPGLLPFIAGLAVGIVLAVLAVVLDAPTLLVALVTAFGGAACVVAGLSLILTQTTVDQLKDGRIGALNGKPLALVAWVGLGAIAF